MNNTIRLYFEQLKTDKLQRRRLICILFLLSLIVAISVFWQLRIIGVSKTDEVYCGYVAHQHDDSCITKTLICGYPEDPAFAVDGTDSVAGDQENTAVHVHTEVCYGTEYTCGMEEHEHTLSCYSNPNADLETAESWEKSLPSELTGVWSADLVSVARSQLDYKESSDNYAVAEDGVTMKGYTRYGQWSGDSYGDWNAMFISFCLAYAGIPQSDFPYADDYGAFTEQLKTAAQYQSEPQSGDIVLLDMEGSGEADHLGVVSEADETMIHTVEGDVDGAVVESRYDLSDPRILGYGHYSQATEEKISAAAETETAVQEIAIQNSGAQVMTNAGSDYTVSVAFDAAAEIPDSAELVVKEIKKGDPNYDSYYQQTLDALKIEDTPAFCRFFDVSFIDEGKEIEPSASVKTKISYDKSLPLDDSSKCTAVHFADDGLELLDAEVETTAKGNSVNFEQDSFSVVGTVIDGTVTLTAGQKYIFYTPDHHALGVVGTAYNGFNVTMIPVTVANNGYITPTGGTDIDRICWKYQNGSLYNETAAMYLNLAASTPTGAGGRYTSTIGLTSSQNTISARVMNNTVKISDAYAGYGDFILAYEYGYLKSGTEFDNAEVFFLTGNVINDSGIVITPGDLEISDDIRNSGCIKPDWNITPPGTVLTYVWEKSTDNGATWNLVERKKITGEMYNVAEDGSWLNVALDDGAEMQYRVSLVAADGSMLETPYRSKAYHVNYYDELKNGGFETPKAYDATSTSNYYQPFVPNETSDLVWKTTAGDGQIEFVSVETAGFQALSQQWHLCEVADKGVQFVELNATQSGALYQDVLTVPGSTMYWQLSHRARGTSYKSGQNDTMYVVIMSTQLAEQNGVTTQAKVLDVINNPGAYPGAEVRTLTSNNISWHQYSGEYEVPQSQYLSRYFFVAGDTASNDSTVGNHLDTVSFSTALPPPDPDKLNLEINKKIVGLSYTDALALLNKMEFRIYNVTAYTYLDNYISGTEFNALTYDGNNTYTASYMVQNLNPATYRPIEVLSGGVADLQGYTRTTSVASASAYEAGNLDSDGCYIDLDNVAAGSMATAIFTNSYERSPVDITLAKENDAKEPLSASFELAEKNGDDWSTISTVTTANGQATLSNIAYDTLYRIKETKAPNGYVQRVDAIYFMMTDSGIQFYNEAGTALAAPADVSAENTTITVVNHVGYVLPKTGGSGICFYMITGTLLMMAGILFGYMRRRKQERRLNN